MALICDRRNSFKLSREFVDLFIKFVEFEPVIDVSLSSSIIRMCPMVLCNMLLDNWLNL